MTYAYLDANGNYFEADFEVPGATSTAHRAPVLPPADAFPAVCSPWQIRKVLNQLELRDAVEAAVAASTDRNLRDGWERATEFRSDDPFVIAMGATLGKTEAEVRAIIELGATL